MSLRKAHAYGFSLIELMISIAILALLVMLGLPSFRQWTLNTHIRTATDSIQNGLRTARNEAVQRASLVRFELDSSTSGGADWRVCAVPSSTTACGGSGATDIQGFSAAGGAADVRLAATAAVASANTYTTPLSGGVPGSSVTFNALGRPSDYGNTSMLRVDASSAQAGAHRLVTIVSAGGMVRTCDPQLALSASGQGCQ